MTADRVIKSLGYLHKIVEAGEKGYAVSASNVNNQGLKILLKSFAQQRARYKSEILAEIQRLGGNAKPRSSIRGALHRGRIDIFAALTIGNKERERVVLNEVVLGERIAVRTYESVLKKELPVETRKIIERQYEEVLKVVEQIHLMRGLNGKRLIVQLFDAEKYANAAIKKLKNAEVAPESIQKIVIHDTDELYKGKGTTVFETSVSGAVGGALWGSVIGAIAGASAEQAASVVSSVGGALDLWSLIAFAGIAAGSLIGGILGYVIGVGISEDDLYLYDQSMVQGKTILLALVKDLQTIKTSQILAQAQVDARSPAHKMPA